jgi:hypothetical protein
MLSRLSRFAPLTGVLAGVAGGFAFASANSPPGASANGADVVRFYASHESGARASDLLWAASFALTLFFAGSLRTHLCRSAVAEGLTMTGMAGAAVLAAAGTLYFNFDYALADVPTHLDDPAAQALNVLALQMALGAGVGLLVFGVSMGLAIVRCDVLPRWLGWVAIVIGIAGVTPAFIVVLPFFLLWMIVTSIAVLRRAGRPHSERAAPADPTVGMAAT